RKVVTGPTSRSIDGEDAATRRRMPSTSSVSASATLTGGTRVTCGATWNGSTNPTARRRVSISAASTGGAISATAKRRRATVRTLAPTRSHDRSRHQWRERSWKRDCSGSLGGGEADLGAHQGGLGLGILEIGSAACR